MVVMEDATVDQTDRHALIPVSTQAVASVRQPAWRRAGWTVRGRGGVIAAVTVAAAVAGAAVSYLTAQPIYESRARLTFRTDDGQPVAQLAAAECSAVMANVTDPSIKAHLVTDAGDTIELRARHAHPDVAHASVHAVIDEYVSQHVTARGRLVRLERARLDLLARQTALREELATAARLETAYNGVAQRVAMLRGALHQIELARIVAAAAPLVREAQADDPTWVRLTLDAPAAPDRRRAAGGANQPVTAARAYRPVGWADAPPIEPVHPAERALAHHEARGDQRGDVAQGLRIRVDAGADHTRLKQLVHEAERDLEDLAARLREAEQAQRMLERVAVKLDAMSAVTVHAGAATQPTQPVRDPRPGAALRGGALAGVLALFGAWLVCLSDHRVRSGAQACDIAGLAPLIGSVPRLASDAYDAQGAAAAARHVHEIRALLQASMFNTQAGALAITGPSRGSGKTSITVGLGVSFALSGAKVLVIDCDFTGGGMRHRARQTRHDTDTPPRRSAHVRLTSEGLDETLVGLGYVPRGELDDALTLSEPADFGIVGCLNGKAVDACAMPTRIAGLSVLSAATAQAEDVDRLSPTAIRRLIDDARRSYDIVLIDTAPTPGSIEGMLASAAADAVLLNVCHGEDRDELERSIVRLRMIGAKVAGVVYNRDPHADDDETRDLREADPGARESRADAQGASSLGSGLLAVAIETNAEFADFTGEPRGDKAVSPDSAAERSRRRA